MFANVTSDYQQPLAQIRTTARLLTEEVCSVILRDHSCQCLNVTHLRFSGYIFSFSLPRLPPNTTDTGKFNPVCYLQMVYLKYRVTTQKVTHNKRQISSLVQ